MTVGADKDLIHLFKIYLDDKTVYISTSDIQLTHFFDGSVLAFPQFEEVLSDGELAYSGGMSIIGSTRLIIARGNDNSNFSDFENTYYPSGKYLINRFINYGMVWNGATLDSHATWIMQYKIVDVLVSPSTIEFVLDSNNEFSGINVPYYKMQDNYDDGISYIEYLSTDEKEMVVPALYGDFYTAWTSLSWNFNVKKLAKTILSNKNLLEYKFAYHKCYQLESNYKMFKYIKGANNFLIMTADDYNVVNSQAGASIQLNPEDRTYGEYIYGTLYIANFVSGGESDIADVSSVMDLNTSNYILLQPGERVSFKVNGNISTSEVGMLNPIINDLIKFEVAAITNNGVTGSMNIVIHSDRGYSSDNNKTVSGTSNTRHQISFGTHTAVKPNTNLPWTVEELCNVEYVVINTGSNAIRITNPVIYTDAIVVQQYHSTYKGKKVKIKISRS